MYIEHVLDTSFCHI